MVRWMLLASVALLLSVGCAPEVRAQAAVATSQGTGAVATDPLSALTAEQKTRFQVATGTFDTGDYAGALPGLRELLKELPAGAPAQVVVAKYASESALNVGDREYGFSLLKPLLVATPDDWQAQSLLVRAYAESGQKVERDAALAHLMDLRKRGLYPQLNRMDQFLMERVPIKDGFIRIWYSFVPWGQYKTYMFARVYDDSAQQVLRVTLESSDFDQPQFAKEHPEMAAKGMRRFSLDGYGQDKKLENGQVNQTHMTFGFYDGQPSYDTVRDRMVAIAAKQVSPISSMTPGNPKK